jgi:hypothetical protein
LAEIIKEYYVARRTFRDVSLHVDRGGHREYDFFEG